MVTRRASPARHVPGVSHSESQMGRVRVPGEDALLAGVFAGGVAFAFLIACAMNAGGVQHGRRMTSFMRLSLYKSPSLAAEKEETE